MLVTNNASIYTGISSLNKKNECLENIYLQKTNYKIMNQVVYSEEMPIESPKNLLDHIQSFENGQVYEIVYKAGGL